MSDEQTAPSNAVRIDIDQSSLVETPTLVEQIETAALRAGAALGTIGARTHGEQEGASRHIDKVVDALCAMVVSGTTPERLSGAGRALSAAIRVAIADLSGQAGAERTAQ